MKAPNIIISGGGTGGHIYPAISIANELKLRNRETNILFVGAEDRMEMEMVPQAGYEIEGLWISGFQRKLTFKNALFPVKLAKSLYQSRQIINRFRPHVAVGTGGFASGPLLQIAHRKGTPTLLQEQNSYPGITNKILAKKTNTICTAYEGMEKYFPKQKIVLTGNPVRQDLLNLSGKKEEAQAFFNLNPNKKVLLVLGGSLGARKINQLIEDNLEDFQNNNVQLIWQTGSLYFVEYRKYDKKGSVQTFSFINRMDLAYAAADIIISRAGAGTVSELSIVGKPVFFIPSPNVAEDHQSKNALSVSEKDAAVVIAESSLETQFKTLFFSLLDSEEKMKSLGENFRALAKPNATVAIVDEIEKLLYSQK